MEGRKCLLWLWVPKRELIMAGKAGPGVQSRTLRKCFSPPAGSKESEVRL